MTGTAVHGDGAPSPWVLRWAHLMRVGGTVLDVACGSGRHFRWLASRGFRVTGVDRDGESLRGLEALGEVVRADIEQDTWPFGSRRFDTVLVTNYLWRPLWPTLLDAVTSGGLYLHETFAAGNETVGRPRRAEFLLQPGELLQACSALRIVAFEDGYLDDPPRFVQRIVARRPAAADAAAPPLCLALAAQATTDG